MRKIPCIEYNPKSWNYIESKLKEFGYQESLLDDDWMKNPIIVINLGGKLGNYSNVTRDDMNRSNRELIFDEEEFLRIAADLRGYSYAPKCSYDEELLL